MSELKYTLIKDDEQYHAYCDRLENLVASGLESQGDIDEYELLHLLITQWDEQHRLLPEFDPVELVRAFMDDYNLNQTELGEIAGVGRSYISEILNYKKRMSKNVIRNLADHFNVRQEALNKSYRLEGEKIEQEKGSSNTSPIFDIRTGDMVSYEEDSSVHASSKEELEYSLAN